MAGNLFAMIFIRGFAGILCLTVVSCVTIRRPHEPISIPVVFQPLFMACAPIDRDAIININKNQARVFTAAMVWSFSQKRQAEIQFNSPVGDTMFQLSRNGSVWKVEGQDSLKVEENGQGVVSVNGYDLPLLADEIGCVMSGVWPVDWLSKLEFVERHNSRTVLWGQDNLREIELTLPVAQQMIAGPSGDTISCAVLKWGGFLGLMRKKITVCREPNHQSLKVTMSGLNDYSIDWVINNES